MAGQRGCSLNLVLHTAAGGVAGRRLPPPAAFVAGVLSHVALDLLAHADPPRRQRRLKLDATSAFLTLVVCAWRYGLTSGAVAGAMGGVLPDAEHFFRRLRRFRYRPIFPTHVAGGWLHSRIGHRKLPESQQLLAGLALAGVLLWQGSSGYEPRDVARKPR